MNSVEERNENTYKTVNAFTHKPSLQQVLAVVLHLFELLVYLLCVFPSVAPRQAVHASPTQVSPTLLCILFLCLLALFLRLSLFDPVDEAVYKPSPAAEIVFKTFTNKYCERCGCHVSLSSKHCSVCDRCCYEFDHHCTFLNNCIGSRNYRQFAMLLVVSILYQSLWIYDGAVGVMNSESVPLYAVGNSDGRKYITVASIVAAILILLFVTALALFHLVLRCIFAYSTYRWIKQSSKTDQGPPEITYEGNQQMLASKVIEYTLTGRDALNRQASYDKGV